MRKRNPAWRSREALCLDLHCWIFLAGCWASGGGPGVSPWLSITQAKQGLSTTELYLWRFVTSLLALNLQSSSLSLPRTKIINLSHSEPVYTFIFLTDH